MYYPSRSKQDITFQLQNLENFLTWPGFEPPTFLSTVCRLRQLDYLNQLKVPSFFSEYMFNYTQVTMTLVNFTTLQQYLPKKLYKTYHVTRDHGNIYIANLGGIVSWDRS